MPTPTNQDLGEISPWKVAWTNGKQAAWQSRLPGLCLWVFGIAIILGYYNVESVHRFFESIGKFKTQSGLIFGIVSTSIFGGLLPLILPVILGTAAPTVFLGATEQCVVLGVQGA